eukprot:30920-Pelagococcus_subviridis.AAC.22
MHAFRAAVSAPIRGALAANSRTVGRSTSRRSVATRAASSIHDFTLKTLGGGTRESPVDGAALPLSQFKGKLNALAEKYGDDLVILGVPSNQFGHQCYDKDFELLNTLKHVRPGDGYVPKFTITEKMEVNGENEHAFWTYLKSCIPYPADDRGGTGADFIYQTQPNSMPIQWSPVRRSDVTWNFEKFLIGKDGVPAKRFSPKLENAALTADIDALIKA